MFNVYVWAEYDRGDVKLYTLNFTLWEKSFCLDTGIECLLTVSRPIGAVKFEEGGSVGNGERCLDDEHLIEFAGLVKTLDEILMRHGLCLRAADGLHVLAQSVDAWGDIFGEELLLTIRPDVGKDVGSGINQFLNAGQHISIRLVGIESGNATSRLQRISHVGNDDPVTMAQKGKLSSQHIAPSLGFDGGCGGFVTLTRDCRNEGGSSQCRED